MNPPSHFAYAPLLARAGRRLTALFLRRGRSIPPTVAACRALATSEGPQSALFDISRELTIVLGFACLMGDLSVEGWVTPEVDAFREVPAAPSLGLCRDPSPAGPAVADSGV